MARIILKGPYLKAGKKTAAHLNNLVTYIATRDGVEKYLDYIAHRPRVEKLTNHGLFTAGAEPLVLSQIAAEIAGHTGNVWLPIISLRGEDAARLGYDHAYAWQALLSEKAVAIAEHLKIHPDRLKWYAAFHNEATHPHVHMICYSTDPSEGYLTKQGIKKMKSVLATEIFRQELIPLYREKTQRRDELKEQATEALRMLILQMKNGDLQSVRIEQLLGHLAERLQTLNGKKQYGYLKSDLKNTVNEIVDELAKDSRVAEAYRLWWAARGRIAAVYTETPAEPPPLSRCDDFKAIRNIVIQEALRIGRMSLDEPTLAETTSPPSAHAPKVKTSAVLSAGTRLLRHVSRIFSDNVPPLKSPIQRTDRKLLQKLREKKQAQGHAEDDREQTLS